MVLRNADIDDVGSATVGIAHCGASGSHALTTLVGQINATLIGLLHATTQHLAHLHGLGASVDPWAFRREANTHRPTCMKTGPVAPRIVVSCLRLGPHIDSLWHRSSRPLEWCSLRGILREVDSIRTNNSRPRLLILSLGLRILVSLPRLPCFFYSWSFCLPVGGSPQYIDG